MYIHCEYVASYELSPVADDPGEDDASDTVAISDGHTGSTDVDIFRRSAVCFEVDISVDMDCVVVELSDVTILRRRSPQVEDSVEHQEGCIGISNGAVEFKDGVFRWLRLPRTELFAEGMEEKCVVPRTDTVSSEQEDRTFSGRNHHGGLLSRKRHELY